MSNIRLLATGANDAKQEFCKERALMKETFYAGLVLLLVLWLGSNMTSRGPDVDSGGHLSERVLAIYQEGRLPLWQQSDVSFLQEAARRSQDAQSHAVRSGSGASQGGQ
jgi:hypothetical protein